MRVDQGLVFLSDSRTNAGVDHVATFRKMTVFEQAGHRVMCALTAGNLAITQAVIHELQAGLGRGDPAVDLYAAPTLFDGALIVGRAIRTVHARDGEALASAGAEFNISMLFGGQIAGEEPRLFNVYAAGNFIEACAATPFFQIGETKYGKPILDRVITNQSSLRDAAKCALISFDSTIKSNISVAPPIDLLVLPRDRLINTGIRCITETDPYFLSIRKFWSEGLRQAFRSSPDPDWPDV